MIIILDNEYPSRDHLYSDWFVHHRAKGYLSNGLQVVVCSVRRQFDYVFEGVQVRSFNSYEEVYDFALRERAEAILVHFAERDAIDGIFSDCEIPLVVWAHGFEVLNWRRRWFNITWSGWLPKAMYRRIRANIGQLRSYRRMIEKTNVRGNAHFIFVSNWIRDAAIRDVGAAPYRYSIIPNPIETDVFRHIPKPPEARFNVLTVRPFTARNYATDVVVRTILRLSQTDEFASFNFRIFGRGPLYQRQIAKLQHFPNVEAHERFLTHEEIAEQHRWAGVFLYPTRTDTQGVSMCEAMASGLVPVTTRVAAIPEFVEHDRTGLLSRGQGEHAQNLQRLAADPQLFLRLSQAASESISEKCGSLTVLRAELAVIESTIAVR